jgi:phosphotransferase system enzyme I (PtsI)
LTLFLCYGGTSNVWTVWPWRERPATERTAFRPVAVTKRKAHGETRLKGVPLSPGFALGRVCFYERQAAEPATASPSDPLHETQRLDHALRWLARQRSVLARQAEAALGQEHAAIFEAHRLMLADEAFRSQLARSIEENSYSAEQAVREVLDRYRAQFEAADSEYVQQRAADISEIQQGLLGHLGRFNACRRCSEAKDCSLDHCRLGHQHILVGEDITANLPIETDDNTVGFIVDKGGPNSHAVILARALHCPVVGNIHNPLSSIPIEADVLVDGDSGEVILNPSEATLARYQNIPPGRGRYLAASAPVPGLRVMANIGRSLDIGDALASGAEGVGLYRTEMELLMAGRLLNEAEQFARYSEVLRAMAGRPVCIRLLDLGSDKTADWLETTLDGPRFAGLRGPRLLLAFPDLLRAQARALARASVYGPIHVLYPMISGVGQFLEMRDLFEQSVTDLQPTGLQHGVLFEVPAACLAARQLLQAADFGCIGTNDLIQYLFGEDRVEGSAVDQSNLETDPVLWKLIEQLSRTAADAGKPLAICGELAGNPDLTCRIIDSGITAISTSPSNIAQVRKAAQGRAVSPQLSPER